MDTGTLAVNGTRLYYEAAGAGSAVILLHGGNLDQRMWDPQFATLAREHRVVRYDLRGFGRSAGQDGPFQAHEDLRALLDTLHIRRASLVGLLGIAWLGSAYTRPAMERPELVGPLREMAGANGKAWMSLLKRGDVERVLTPPALTATLRVPTLLVIGTRDTGDMQAIADTPTATVPGIRRVTFEGAGHLTNMEQPARFTDVIRSVRF